MRVIGFVQRSSSLRVQAAPVHRPTADRPHGRHSRRRLVQLAFRHTTGLCWSPSLFLTLVEELHVGDELADLVGDLSSLAPTEYPQAIAMALVLRHSWRVDDLDDLMRRLQLDGNVR